MSNDSRAFVGFAATAAIPAFVVADSLAAFLRGWKPDSKPEWLVIFAALLWLVFCCTTVAIRRGRGFLISRGPQLTTCAVVTMVAWLSAEWVLDIYSPAKTLYSFHRRPAASQWVFHPIPDMFPGVEGESKYTVNSHSIRGTELPHRDAAYRILCVGGSTTECIYLDDSETWPSVLMEAINKRSDGHRVWIGNFGISGHSTVQHLRLFAEDDLWKQMDCIVCLSGANDMQHFLRHGRGMQSRAHVELDAEFAQPTWKWSNILRTSLRVYEDWRQPRLYVEDRRGTNYAVRRKQRHAAARHDRLPDLSDALSDYERRIASIIKMCRDARVRVIFLTQPTLYGSNTPPEISSLFWLGDDGIGKFYDVDDLAQGLQRFNERLQQICDSHGVECIDLSSMNGRAEFFYDEYHFTEAGAREVALLVDKQFGRSSRRAKHSRRPSV